MPNEVVVELCDTEEDLAAAHHILMLVFASKGRPVPPLANLRNLFESMELLIAKIGPTVVGFRGFRIGLDGVGRGANVGVHPDYRRMGIGALLVEETRAVMRERNVKWWEGTYEDSDAQARAFWEALGVEWHGAEKRGGQLVHIFREKL